MRRLLTAEEINTLIDSMSKEEATWISNENERREGYKQIIANGNHLELIKKIKAIYLHKQEREAAGKRLHMPDERFFKDAEQILYNEFQYVLKLNGTFCRERSLCRAPPARAVPLQYGSGETDDESIPESISALAWVEEDFSLSCLGRSVHQASRCDPTGTELDEEPSQSGRHLKK